MAILASTERARLATLTSIERSIPALNFNGSSQFLSRGGGLTGAADGALGIFCCFLNTKALGTAQVILFGDTNDVQIFLAADGEFRVILNDAANAEKVDFVGSTLLVPGVSYSILASWNTATEAAGAHLYINNKNVKDDNNYATGDIDYTLTDWGLGTRVDGSNLPFGGDLGPVYFNTAETMDFSVEANRRKFVTAANSPAQFGADGSTPTGNQPIIYLDGKTVDGTNLGSGGNFSVLGDSPTAGYVTKRKKTQVIPNGCHV